MKKEDKKLDQLLRDYVQSTKGDVEEDFAKLDFSKYEQTAPQKKGMPKYGWALIAMTFMVVLTLSISLPLTLRAQAPSGPEIFYFEIDTVNQEEVDNIDTIKEDLGNNIILPKTQAMTSVLSKLSADNKNLGYSLDLNIYDEYVNIISGFILYNNIELSSLSQFYNLHSNYVWDEINVSFKKEIDMSNLSYNYNITFSVNGLTYYYTITTVAEMDIADLMSWVF